MTDCYVPVACVEDPWIRVALENTEVRSHVSAKLNTGRASVHVLGSSKILNHNLANVHARMKMFCFIRWSLGFTTGRCGSSDNPARGRLSAGVNYYVKDVMRPDAFHG